jgi:hypothetical protein
VGLTMHLPGAVNLHVPPRLETHRRHRQVADGVVLRATDVVARSGYRVLNRRSTEKAVALEDVNNAGPLFNHERMMPARRGLNHMPAALPFDPEPAAIIKRGRIRRGAGRAGYASFRCGGGPPITAP